MTPQEFCYWLNGHFDLNPKDELTEDQVTCIRDHLATVFDQQIKPVKEPIGWPEPFKQPIFPNIPPFPDHTPQWEPTKIGPINPNDWKFPPNTIIC